MPGDPRDLGTVLYQEYANWLLRRRIEPQFSNVLYD